MLKIQKKIKTNFSVKNYKKNSIKISSVKNYKKTVLKVKKNSLKKFSVKIISV